MTENNKASQYVTVTMVPSTPAAIITLNRPPVNSMNLAVWSGLLSSLDSLEKQQASGSVRAVIFMSGVEKDVFTAGNDIKELYSKSTNASRYTEFWTAQTTFLTRLYKSPLVTIAAIRGACPAGGCALAMCCDYRIMIDDASGRNRIGLNEVALGISVPHYWIEVFARIVGRQAAEAVLLQGDMFTTKQAQQLGLIHQLASDPADLQAKTTAALKRYLRFPDGGRILTKQSLRAELADRWQAYCAQEADNAWKMLSTPQITDALGKVLQRLSGNTNAPKAKL